MRKTWVDVAKGLAIFLVVVHHTVQMMDASDWGWAPVTAANAALQTFRMPLFFFVSGLFFTRSLQKPWREFLTSKVAKFIYLYLLWSALRAVFFTGVPWILSDQNQLLGLAAALLWPTTGLWYVYALPLYFLVARLLASTPAAVKWGIPLLLTVVFASGFVSTGGWAWDSILGNFLYFSAGVYLNQVAFRLADHRSRWQLLVAALAWVTMTGVVYLADLGPESLLRVPISVIAIIGGVLMSVELDRGRLAGVLQHLGQNTLPIYVMHVFLVGALFAFWKPSSAVSPLTSVAILAVVVVAAIWACLLIRRATNVLPWLYQAPWLIRPRAAMAATR